MSVTINQPSKHTDIKKITDCNGLAMPNNFHNKYLTANLKAHRPLLEGTEFLTVASIFAF